MINKIKPVWFLVLGIVTMFLSHKAFSIDLVAWISSVPFLIYLSRTKGFKSRLFFVLALTIAWTVTVFKIITPPVPYMFVILYSLPISLFHLPGYLLVNRFKKHKLSFLLFPLVMTIMEWIQYTLTPFGTWGIAAYTQSHTLSLMQSVSLFGVAGLSFIIYWVNISITEIVVRGKTTRSTFQIPIILLLTLLIFGSLRFDISKSKGIDTIPVAAIGTDSELRGLPLPDKDVHDQVISGLFKRTRIAANAGAKLVVWNEAATFTLPENESAWTDSLKSLSTELNISLIAAYVMPTSISPFRYENKYLFIDPDGNLLYTYHKHQPVPGEPAIPGEEALSVFDVAESTVGGAICYDYDFPYLAKGFGKLNADIVALPSSDWRGIDPIHTKMAAFRAVEQGHSIIRSTRFGLSAAITPFGEMIAQMSSFDDHDKIMLAHLPAKGQSSLYSIIGDMFVYLCFGFLVLILFLVLRSQNRIE